MRKLDKFVGEITTHLGREFVKALNNSVSNQGDIVYILDITNSVCAMFAINVLMSIYKAHEREYIALGISKKEIIKGLMATITDYNETVGFENKTHLNHH